MLYKVRKQWKDVEYPWLVRNDLYMGDALVMHAAGNTDVYDYVIETANDSDDYQEVGMPKPMNVGMLRELHALHSRFPIMERPLTESERVQYHRAVIDICVKYGRLDCLSDNERQEYQRMTGG